MSRPLRCLDEAPSDQVVRSLRERIDLLEEMVRQYREANESIAAYPLAWKLTRKEASLLARLQRAKGEAVSKENLMVALYGLEVDVEPKIIDVFVCKIRRKVSGAGIEIRTFWGLGYRLTLESVAELRRLSTARQDVIAGIVQAPDPAAVAEVAALTARIAELEAENARLVTAAAPVPPAPPAVIPTPPQRVRGGWREFVKAKPKHRAGAAPGLRIRGGGAAT